MEIAYAPRHGSTRSSNGCWTCRLRRKKCDENYPVCETCTALHITCHYSQDKPEWMDGGSKQEEMAMRLKRQVKEQFHRRHDRGAVNISNDRFPLVDSVANESRVLARGSADNQLQGECDCRSNSQSVCKSTTSFERSNTIFVMFYLENVLPFLFPFYQPSFLQGGKAWILEMIMNRPVVRQATLCQSSYFLSLARGTEDHDGAWETVLAQTRATFAMLRESLQIIVGSHITEHLPGAVRIMTSIMQLQRFEIAVLSFTNCRPHLNAALALFKQLLDSTDSGNPPGSCSFSSVINSLNPSSLISPGQVPSAEQAAFCFSSALLIFDDIIASTVLQEQPRLYEYHHSLLEKIDGIDPPINLEGVVGCQNWALLAIGEIAALDTWKQQCKGAGNLDVMEVVKRATAIKNSLGAHLRQLETRSTMTSQGSNLLLEIFTTNSSQQSDLPTKQTPFVTRVWAHAALIYLFVVVSGWQATSVDVHYHVDQIIELLTNHISPPALLRTMVWPFCIAGCLANPTQEVHFRRMAEALQPSSVFGTVRKALEIMENVWYNRDVEDASSRNFAACFEGQGDLVLLV
ncbi:fungal-specific transcription factor domain-containing protein [Talaromyces proteolyticus]|uniref:Fungal-specific transcription factor domain-containing protein n=1 Tax=Talaromyces proteolyticus TaxID=1131652 RepID=A0AAD4KGT7_9EURO|nr:fungal-specific transcription factor domain-containing protein [Talaromyces proteolyticus]KAH8690753.1 fungal-specific transcription factor domain-containing protein [Talaromyces proteolyticus]